jgi:hypothetical protein
MALLGRNAKITVSGSATVVDAYNWTITTASEPITQPVFGDTWDKVHGLAINSWEGSFECISSTADTTGQSYIINAQLNATVISGAKFYLDTTKYYTGDIYVTNHEVSTSPTDVARTKFSFKGTGVLTQPV